LSRRAQPIKDNPEPCKKRSWLRLGDAAGLTQFGVNLVRLAPGVWVKNGHCFQNRSAADAVLLVVGSRNDADYGEYSDIDMTYRPGPYSGAGGYRKKDGTPY
jgi:uncharacterized cupin superfamily protein